MTPSLIERAMQKLADATANPPSRAPVTRPVTPSGARPDAAAFPAPEPRPVDAPAGRLAPPSPDVQPIIPDLAAARATLAAETKAAEALTERTLAAIAGGTSDSAAQTRQAARPRAPTVLVDPPAAADDDLPVLSVRTETAAAPLPTPAAPASDAAVDAAVDEAVDRAVARAMAEAEPAAATKALDETTPLEPDAAPITIPLDALRERGFLIPGEKSSPVHQEFRLIKRRLLDNAFGSLKPVARNGQRVMVTSALPSEGKTFCAINLAISIAIGGEHPVILVDADIARPTIARRLGFEDCSGVADLLDDPSLDPDRLILSTDIPGLKLLPAGRLKERPVDLLASSTMTSLLDALSLRHPDHVIILDTPPLLAVTECRSLAAQAGQVLMIVAAGETPRAAVVEALAQLETCEIVGLVLNKAPARTNAPAYYGY